ncbi:histamine H2 receptor [Silurus asotus]|uniref:Histamine H2 receptor n=1 Tax=Silurus asotus TaxID=30991 RepID=A0AAD5B1N7_SILAS|nr:histamine H2 receptor [Silurus asotus]
MMRRSDALCGGLRRSDALCGGLRRSDALCGGLRRTDGRFRRRLRSVTNCFIVSLAITDLLLGVLVLPFSTLIEVTGDWPLGAYFCNVYISMDVMLSTASILNLLAISIDRYIAVTVPLRYPTLVLPWHVGTSLAVIWVVSIGVSFVPIHLGWNTVDQTVQNHGKDDPVEDCRFELNPTYVLVDSVATFYLPLVAMCWTYYRVFRIARAQAKRILSIHRACSATTMSSLSGVSMLALREHKAAVRLAVVLGAFVVCWFPYFTFFTIMGIRKEPDLPRMAYSVVLWLGYANSTLNPFLYAALNRDFRSAYGRLLFGWRGNNTPTGTPTTMPEAGLLNELTPSSSRAEFIPKAYVMLQDMGKGNEDETSGTSLSIVSVLSNGQNRMRRQPQVWGPAGRMKQGLTPSVWMPGPDTVSLVPAGAISPFSDPHPAVSLQEG